MIRKLIWKRIKSNKTKVYILYSVPFKQLYHKNINHKIYNSVNLSNFVAKVISTRVSIVSSDKPIIWTSRPFTAIISQLIGESEWV